MDIWGVGCVMFEIIGLFPLFPGKNELDQVHKIHNVFIKILQFFSIFYEIDTWNSECKNT